MENAIQPIGTILLWWGFGLLGILIHFGFKVMEGGTLTISGFWLFVKTNSLVVVMNVIVYSVLVALWASEGVEFMGWTKGQLTGSTALLGFIGNSIFKSIVTIRVARKVEDAEK